MHRTTSWVPLAGVLFLLLAPLAATVEAQVNVALGKPVIDGSGSWAGGEVGVGAPFDGGQFPARLAVDGVTTEPANGPVGYWLGREQTLNEYFTLDLGQPFQIDQVNLYNTHNRQFNDRDTGLFLLQGALEIDDSLQLVNPFELAEGVLSDTTGQDQIIPDVFTADSGLNVAMARYLRFEAINHFLPAGSGLNEIEVFDFSFVSPNRALGKPVIDGSGSWDGGEVGVGAPFDGGMFPATAVTSGSLNDGAGEYWLGREGVVDEYFVLDLEEVVDIQEILLRNTRNGGSADRGTREFRILAAQEVDAALSLVDPVEILNSRLPNTAGVSPLLETIFTADNGLVPTSARYLRFEALGDTYFNDSVGLNEIEVYDEILHEPTSIPEDNNIAYGKPIIDGSGSWDGGEEGVGAEFNEGPFPANRVTDGSLADNHINGGRSSYWLGRQDSLGELEEYLTLDLGEIFTIEEVALTNTDNSPFGDRGTDEFILYGATDVDENNQLLDPVTLIQGNLSDAAGQTVIMPDVFNADNGLNVVDARYLQFVALTANGPNGVGLNEIAVFGQLAGGDFLAGDFNGNGLVEQQDLDLVLGNWGQDAANAPANWTNDPPEGNIDQTELDKVLANWGNTAVAGISPATVPEPATICLLALCLAAMACRRKGSH